MVNLIKIDEIDEFSEIKTIKNEAINKTILNNVKQLDEISELENYIRNIIFDPNKTPHGPTEKADILTTHLNVHGKRKFTSFVLKGKSVDNVKDKDVAHQFLKLHKIENLDLIIFGAVGNIQDSAFDAFMHTVHYLGCDYLIIDAQDFSRLFIAYEKICPRDGTSFNKQGICKNNHERNKGLTLEMKVREKEQYTIKNQKDKSFYGAKRYSAIIQVDRHYSKDIIRNIIFEVTEKLKKSQYYRNKQIEKIWGKLDAHIIWLYIAFDDEDIQNANWFCRTYWVDQSLPKNMHPIGLNGNEKYKDIDILWNDNYESLKKYFRSITGNKEEVLNTIEEILNQFIEYGEKAINNFDNYKNKIISEEEFLIKIQESEPIISALLDKANNICLPPTECADFDQACQNLFLTVYNIYQSHSRNAIKSRSKSNREYLIKMFIEQFYKDVKRIEFEKNKLN